MSKQNDTRLVDEFDAFRRAMPTAFAPQPTVDVFAAARSRTLRRRTLAGAGTVAAVVVAVLALLSWRPDITSTPPTTTVPSSPLGISPATPSGTPSTTPSGPSPTLPAVPRDVGNDVRFLPPDVVDRVRGMTITLPAWPDAALRKYCPAARYTFADGRVATGGAEAPVPRGRWTYSVLQRGARGVLANLDGRPGDEIVLEIACGDVENLFQLLVIQPDGAGMKALGYVADDGSVPAVDRFHSVGGDLVVEAANSLVDAGFEQRRRYRWNGSRFMQVDGPTSFPETNIKDVGTVDLRNASFNIELPADPRRPDAQNNFSTILSFVDGKSGLWPYRSDDFTHQGADVVLGQVTNGSLNEQDDDGERADALVTVTVRWDDGLVSQYLYRVTTGGQTVRIVATGMDGVSAVRSHRIVDGLAEVTVATTAGVDEMRRYRSNRYSFERVN